jgi:beta-glucosidase-like glycosyl hydrolase
VANNIIPYKKLIEESAISAVMVAHVMYPKIDSAYPATYSKKIIQVLRDELKYSGLIFTDDIQMMGANIFPSIRERAIQAFLAGNDMIMIAWNYTDQLEAFNGIIDAVRSGRISEDRLNESLTRILKYKHKFKLFDGIEHLSTREISSLRVSPGLKQTINDITSEIFSQEAKKLGPANLESTVPILAFGADASFLNSLKHLSTWNTKCFLLKKNTPFEKLVTLEKHGHDFVGVFYVTGTQSAAILNKMPNDIKNSFIVVNTLYPGALENSSSYKAVFEVPTRNSKIAELLLEWMKTSDESGEENIDADITSIQ